jgi:hypothetical protein
VHRFDRSWRSLLCKSRLSREAHLSNHGESDSYGVVVSDPDDWKESNSEKFVYSIAIFIKSVKKMQFFLSGPG